MLAKRSVSGIASPCRRSGVNEARASAMTSASVRLEQLDGTRADRGYCVEVKVRRMWRKALEHGALRIRQVARVYGGFQRPVTGEPVDRRPELEGANR